jgi:hypothetical protein
VCSSDLFQSGGGWDSNGKPTSAKEANILARKGRVSLCEASLYGNVSLGLPYPGNTETIIEYEGARLAQRTKISYERTNRNIYGRYTVTALKALLDQFSIAIDENWNIPVTGTITKVIVTGTQQGNVTRYEPLILSSMNKAQGISIYSFYCYNTYTNANERYDVNTGTSEVICSITFV